MALALVWELGQQTTTLPAVRWRQTQPSPHVQHAVLQRPSPALELELELELVLELVLALVHQVVRELGTAAHCGVHHPW